VEHIISEFVRNVKFTIAQHKKIRAYLWVLCKEDPTRHLNDYVHELAEIGFSVSTEFVRQIFIGWKWSFKKPSYKQMLKYTKDNMKRYKDYIEWIALQDLKKLKFLDEVHFVSKRT
jgi:hypothetical protein